MTLPIRTTLAAALAAAALASAGGLALAHGVSEHTEGVESAAAQTKDAVTADAKRTKLASKILGLLGKRTNERSLADEIRSVAAVAKIAETSFADQPALLAALETAADEYEADLRTAKQALDAAAASDQISPKLRKRYQKAVARVGAALAPGKVPTPLADRLQRYAGAAAAAKGFTPYDGGAAHAWVLSAFALAPQGQGVDLTGDGEPDNAFASIQGILTLIGSDVDVNDLFADGVTQGGRYGLLEMWYVQDLAKGDPFVFAGILGGTDADGDAGNDLLGTGSFAPVPETLGTDGHALVRAASTVAKGGKFRIEFTGQTLELGGVTLPPGARLVLQGTAAPDSNAGLVGVAVPAQAVADTLTANGITLTGLQLFAFNRLADVDLDGNGTNDAFSAAFTYESVKAAIALDP